MKYSDRLKNIIQKVRLKECEKVTKYYQAELLLQQKIFDRDEKRKDKRRDKVIDKYEKKCNRVDALRIKINGMIGKAAYILDRAELNEQENINNYAIIKGLQDNIEIISETLQ